MWRDAGSAGSRLRGCGVALGCPVARPPPLCCRLSPPAVGWTAPRSLFRFGFPGALWTSFVNWSRRRRALAFALLAHRSFVGLHPCPHLLLPRESWASLSAPSPRCWGGCSCVCLPWLLWVWRFLLCRPWCVYLPLAVSIPVRPGGVVFAFGVRPAWVFFHRRARVFSLLLLADSQGAWPWRPPPPPVVALFSVPLLRLSL